MILIFLILERLAKHAGAIIVLDDRCLMVEHNQHVVVEESIQIAVDIQLVADTSLAENNQVVLEHILLVEDNSFAVGMDKQQVRLLLLLCMPHN